LPDAFSKSPFSPDDFLLFYPFVTMLMDIPCLFASLCI